MRRRHLTASAALLAFVTVSAAGAQGAAEARFKNGQMDIGPTIGLGGIGDAGVSIGGRWEKGIKDLPEMGGGVLGIMVSADWWKYSYGVTNLVKADYSFINIGVTGNYHIKMTSEKIDPFVGLGLGYSIFSSNVTSPGGFSGSFGESSGIYFASRLGVRYRVKPKLSLYGDVGTGAAVVNVGVMFGLGGS